MSVSLLTAEFFLFVIVSVALLSSLSGALRQGVFLAANLSFVFYVLGLTAGLSTIVFCIIGFGLAVLQRTNRTNALWPSVLFLVTIFIYMRNYEVLGFLLPDNFLLSTLKTVGLSFVLFKIIHVLIDSRGGTIPNLGFFTYINYCLNFTTFMMGPIQRYQDYHEQWNGLKEAIPLTFESHLDAVLRILVGFVKAYVIGGVLAGVALQNHVDVTQLTIPSLALKLYAFYFFLYMNFSGYCDIVIGIGSLFGVRPPENFNRPFLAQNISDFWLRQHRSLTLWLTDYVFTPTYKWTLGNSILSRYPLLSANLAIGLTMFVSGIWHGTTLGFLLFGITHGIFLMVYHTWNHALVQMLGLKRVKQIRTLWPARALAIFLTFNAASFAFLFFQLDTPNLLKLIRHIF